jgi:ribonuclease HI
MSSLGWLPPPPGLLKVNVDAAVGKASEHGSVAAVARSEDGVFRGASAVVFLGKTEPETLEALACREAMALACDINNRRIMIASDCSAVIRSIEEGSRGVYAHIVQEIADSKTEFEQVAFRHA